MCSKAVGSLFLRRRVRKEQLTSGVSRGGGRGGQAEGKTDGSATTREKNIALEDSRPRGSYHSRSATKSHQRPILTAVNENMKLKLEDEGDVIVLIFFF